MHGERVHLTTLASNEENCTTDPIFKISLSVKNFPMIGTPSADVRVIHSFKAHRCNSPSKTSGSEEPGSDVREYLTIHFHEGGDIGERVPSTSTDLGISSLSDCNCYVSEYLIIWLFEISIHIKVLFF
jgi:hypothetical protein